MPKSDYTQEIKKRIGERIMSRFGKPKRTFVIIAVATLFGNAILFFISKLLWGNDIAIQNLYGGLGLSAVIEFLLFGGFWVSWHFIDIPEEIFNEQKKTVQQLQDTIEEYEAKRLKIEFLHAEYSYDPTGLDILAKSFEGKKIIELEVRLHRAQQFVYDSDKESFSKDNIIVDNPLVAKAEIRPDEEFIINLATLSQDEFDKALYRVSFGEIVNQLIDFSKESIYRAFLKISGKLEGETEFRKTIMLFELYAYPEKTYLDSLENAETIGRIDGVLYTEYLKERAKYD